MSALLELLKKKQQDMAASRRSRTAKLTDGTSRWRILPSWRGPEQQFWHDFGQHFVKDAAGTMSAIYMCVDKTFGKPCAVCEAVKQAANAATDDATMKIVQDAKSSARVLVNALHLDGPEPHKVQILELPPTVFEQFAAIVSEWGDAGENVLGQNGKDILIARAGTGKNTKYTVQVAAKTTPLPAGVCDKLNNLDEYVQQESEEQQTRALNSVRALTGLLPAPTSPGLPLAARSGMLLDDGAAVAPTPRAAAAPAFEDVPDLAVARPPVRGAAPPAAAAAPVAAAPVAAASVAAAPVAAAPVAAAPVAEATGDDELDNLIASLG